MDNEKDPHWNRSGIVGFHPEMAFFRSDLETARVHFFIYGWTLVGAVRLLSQVDRI
jgi:hypothetical protein